MTCQLNNDQTTQALVDLLPPGAAFPRVPGSNQERVLRGLAWPITDAMLWGCNAATTELPPGSHVETLNEWEWSLGIPNACTSRGETLQERQAAVKAKWAQRGGATMQYLKDVAAAMGYDVSIRAGTPYRFGRQRLGDPFGSYGRLYVTIHGGPEGQIKCTPYRFGSNRLGDPFQTCGIGELECVYDRIVHAHHQIYYYYEGN